jgi:hypothetical protein
MIWATNTAKPDADPGLAEMNRAERQDAPVEQRLEHGNSAAGLNLLLLLIHLALKPCLALRRQPFRVGRSVGQVEPADRSEDDGWCRLSKEQPFPPREAEDGVQFEERRRDWRAEPDGHRDSGHEAGDDAGAMMRWEPVGEIEDHAGEEAGLGKAEGEPQDKEADWPLGEGEATGYDAPADHDPGNPPAGADLFQDQVARHLQQEIPPEEGTRAEAKHITAQA